MVLALLAGLAWWGFSVVDSDLSAPGGGAITPKQFSGVQIGQARADVRHRLGQPAGHSLAGYFPAAVSATSCDGYTEADTIMDPGAFMICYSGDVVTQKWSCGVFSSPTPTTTDAPDCNAATVGHVTTESTG